LLLVLVAGAAWWLLKDPSPVEEKVSLDQAWLDFAQAMNEAQKRLTDSSHAAPPQSDRNLAEGHRYLLAHIARMIELEMRADPRFPEFHRSMSMLRKWTAENPDTAYLKAPIDATGLYRVNGKAANAQEWQTSERGVAGPKAPRMVTFQTVSNVPGATGELAEMRECRNQTLAFLNSFTLDVAVDGSFSFLIGPERPQGYTGDFLPSKKHMRCEATGAEGEVTAKWLAVREIFSDWENEEMMALSIERLDSIGASKPPIDSAWMAARLQAMAEELPNQIRFWNLLQKYALELYDDENFDGKRSMPVNSINQPAPPFTAGGVAGSRQLYAAGIYDLKPGEALLVKVKTPVEPHYVGFQLSTPWFEGPDQQNYVSSLSGHQLPPASDGYRYYIVASEDPGFAGWVDTTGFDMGTHAMRFIFRENPPQALMPSAEAQLLTIAELPEHLPADTPRITPEARKAEIAIRQAHIKKRWREY
jgi:hypothetical protein